MDGSRADRIGVKDEGRLVSWKAIADYFDCDVRTVRRWERDRSLPVYRAPGGRRSTVFAYISELEAWLQGARPEVNADSALLVDEFGGEEADAHLMEGSPAGVPDAQLRAAVEVREAAQDKIQGRRFQILKRRIWAYAGAAIALALIWGFWSYRARPGSVRAKSSGLTRLNVDLHVPSPDTVALYDRGRFFWNLRTRDGLAKAIDAYTQAIQKDPSYAEAYAGLAESYDLLPQFAHADLGESLIRAENLADRAIALNPNLAAAHRAKAFALFYWDWDIAGSDAEFKRALALDPDSAQTHQWYAGTLQCRSEGAEAIRQIDEAVRLDPTSPAIAADAALMHADFGDFEAGMKALREIARTQPTLSSPAQFLANLDFAVGDFPAYVEDTRRFAFITQAPDAIAMANAVAKGWARDGRTGLLEARAGVLKAAYDRGTESGFLLGQTLLLLGHRREALFYIKASFDRHYIGLINMEECSWAKDLSSDPAFSALLAEIHHKVRAATPAYLEQAQVQTGLPQ